MQPTLNGPLNQTYLVGLETFLGEAAARGMQVVVDLHNYGRYNVNYAQEAAANYGIEAPDQWNPGTIGSPAVPISAFADFWGKLASALSGAPGLSYYDIMNEPHDLGAATIWPNAAQAAVDAIRSVDMNTNILVEGTQWASAQWWPGDNGNLHIVDPANKLLYEAHLYFDGNGSGTYTQQGAYPNIGTDRIQPFLNWLHANNAHGFIGEFGVPGNDPKWAVVLDNFLNTLQANGLSGTYWDYVYVDPSGKNPWWPNGDPLSIRSDNGQNQQLMEVIFSHTAPAIYAFSPDTGTLGDGTTAANSLTFSGVAASHATVQIFDGVTQLGSTTADASGTWTYTIASSSGGLHTFRARDIDVAGTLSQFSVPFVVTVNAQTASSAPTINSYSTDSGAPDDGMTNSKILILTGNAEANGVVKVYDGITLIGYVTASGDGRWLCSTDTLLDGLHTLTAKSADATGSTEVSSIALCVTINSVAPEAPVIVTSQAKGAAVFDVNGTAEAGSTVTLFDGSRRLGTVAADGDGAWTFSTAQLSRDAHEFFATATDAAGNVSETSQVLDFITTQSYSGSYIASGYDKQRVGMVSRKPKAR